MNKPVVRKPAFAKFCMSLAAVTKSRAAKLKVPHNLTSHDLEVLLKEQDWRCAVSNIMLEPPGEGWKNPFAPSVDRIVPQKGYTVGNVRITCMIVNYAMHGWGEYALVQLFEKWRTRVERKAEKPLVIHAGRIDL